MTGQAPEIEGEFDSERAQALIAKLRDENAALKSDKTPQDEKDAKAIAALKRQLDEAKPKLTEYERLVEASKSDLERAQETAAEFQRRAEAAERASLVNEVALAKGLPASLARRLQGDDKAALEADADELLSQFPANSNSPRSPAPDRSQGSSYKGGAAPSPAQEFASIIQGQMRS